MERGCGRRVKGAAYLSTPLSGGGLPLENFLIDPPQCIDPDELGVTPVGVKLLEDPSRPGIFHVLDWVGSEHYPNVADFVEELKRFGLSRRIPKTFPFAKLSKDSKILLIHSRAYIGDYKSYKNGDKPCPKCLKGHGDPLQEMCARLWWSDLEGTEDADGGKVVRQMPSFEYTGYACPVYVVPQHAPAIFCSLPIAQIDVIRDGENFTHESAMEKVEKCGLPVVLQDE